MSFDAIARIYRPVEAIVFGSALQRARVAWLDDVRAARRALIVGEGDGRFLEQLLRAAPDVRVECVDGSGKMLALARARVGDSARVRFVQADLRSFEPQGTYDLVVTHFVLDCFESQEVDKIVERLAAVLAPEGRWLLADFSVPDGRISAARARFWLGVMYRFFDVVAGLRVRTLVDPAPRLEAQGLRRVRYEQHDAGFITSALWQR